jgi:hypothetical protein
VINGGKAGVFVGSTDDGLLDLGDTGADDALFVAGDSGAGDDSSSVAMVPETGGVRSDTRCYCAFDALAQLISIPYQPKMVTDVLITRLCPRPRCADDEPCSTRRKAQPVRSMEQILMIVHRSAINDEWGRV